MYKWLAGAIALAVSVSAFGQVTGSGATPGGVRPGTKSIGTLALLNKRIPEVSFEDLPLDQVIDWLQGYTGVNVVPHWQTLIDAGVPRDKPITIKVKNLRLSQVLWMIMNEAGGADIKLAYRASGNLLILSTAEDLGQELLVRVYEVADLLVVVQNFRSAPQIDIQQTRQQGGGGGGGGQSVFGGAGGGGGGGEDEDNQNTQRDQPGAVNPEMQRLIELIQQTIHPDSWATNGGTGTIQAWRTQLVVRNNIRVHQELGGAVTDSD